MTVGRKSYRPGAAAGASVHKEGGAWTLVLVRQLRHPPEKVWRALTEPAELSQWAPFDADRSLGMVGPAKLSTVGAPTVQVSDITVKRAERPRVLEYSWGGNDLRWELEPTTDSGTRLTLWHHIERAFISWGAAGWHICLDVLEHLLGDEPIGRIVGGAAMEFDWERLNTEYAKQFGIEPPSWSPRPKEQS
jgi:uncharacterized protein YndB with AHSA1/START domain